MQKICLIPSIMLPIPNVCGGAIETLITNLIDINEIEKKVEFTVVSVYNKNAYELSKKYKYTNFIYVKHDIFDFFRRCVRRIFNLKEFPYLNYKAYYKMRNKKFDYIISEGGIYTSFKKFLKKYNYKRNQLLAHIHDHRLASKEVDEIFGNIIAISNFVKKEWYRTSTIKDESRIKVLKNGIDISKFDKEVSGCEIEEIRNKYGFTSDDFVVLFCGRTIEVKGLHKLIEAINEIENKKIKLLVVGSPNFAIKSESSYLNDLKNKIESSKDRIKFTGYIDNTKLYKYYKSSNIMVIPSLWEEAAGLVCIEAMATKTPLIITNSGGMVEYANYQSIIRIDRDEKMIENLKECILKLYNDKDLYNKIKEEEYVKSKEFSKEKYYFDFVKLIEELN